MFITAFHEEELPLLVHTLEIEPHHTTKGKGQQEDNMAAKGINTTSFETSAYDEHHGKTGHGHDSLQLDERGIHETSSNDVAAAEGLAALESDRKSWFGYMKTKDFWIVLVVGYV